jgi:hypothetical protein
MTSEASAHTTTAMQTDVLDRLITGVSPLLNVSPGRFSWTILGRWLLSVIALRIATSASAASATSSLRHLASDGASANEVGVYFGSVR